MYTQQTSIVLCCSTWQDIDARDTAVKGHSPCLCLHEPGINARKEQERAAFFPLSILCFLCPEIHLSLATVAILFTLPSPLTQN